MSLTIESRGLIYDATSRGDDEAIACFTSLCPLSSGAWLASFQVGPAKHAPGNTVRLARSRDEGNSWVLLPPAFDTQLGGTPGSLAAGEMVEAEPGRVLLFTTWFDRSDPHRPLFDPQTEGLLRSRQLVTETTDEGGAWRPWREVSTPGLTGCAVCGPVLRWDDGSLAFAFESFKEYDDPAPPRHAAWLLVSRDGGRTFEAPLQVAQDPTHQTYYWDQRLCPAGRPGEFLGLFWTHDRQAQHDLPVHWLRSSLADRAASRTQPQVTSMPGQIAAPWLLPDGRLLAFVVDRDKPGTLTLWQSPDAGQTWPAEERLVVHTHDEQANLSQQKEGIDFAQYWEDMGKWSFGHPVLRPLDQNRMLLAWYAGTPQRMSIHWARVLIDAAPPVSL